MAHAKLLVLVLGCGLAACSDSTTPLQSAASVHFSRPSAGQGTPPPAATADCAGVDSQQGGGSDYLNCIRKHERP